MLIKLLVLQGLIALLGFASTSILTKVYGIAAFGEITFAIAVANVFACLIRYGYDETLIVRLHKSKYIKSEFLVSLFVRYGLFLTCSCTLFLIPENISQLNLKQVFIVVSFLLTILQLQTIFDFVGKQVLQVSTVAFNKLLIVVFLFIFSYFFDALTNYTISVATANILILAIQFYLYQKIKPFPPASKCFVNFRSILAEQLKGNFSIMVASLLVLSLYSINQIIIKEKLSFIELGVFAVQWQVVNVFVILLKQLTRIYKPKLALYLNSSNTKFRNYFIEYSLVVSFIPSIAGMLIYPFYDIIFGSLFGEGLMGYKNIYILMMLFLFLRGLHLSLTQWFILFQVNRLIMISNMFTLIGVSAVTFMCWDNYSLTDAVLAMIIGMGVAIVFLVICFLLTYCNKKTLSKIKDI